MYPKVFLDYMGRHRVYGPVRTLPTPVFFYGMQPSEEISVEIDPGKTLEIRLQAVGGPTYLSQIGYVAAAVGVGVGVGVGLGLGGGVPLGSWRSVPVAMYNAATPYLVLTGCPLTVSTTYQAV